MLRNLILRALAPRTPAKSTRRRPLSQRLRSYHPAIDPLEDRRLLSVTSATDDSAHVATPLTSGAVVGRHLFYNNSRWDGNNPAPNVTDDSAIATNKSALRGGTMVTFANYSNYEAGINGVMVDIAGLAGTPTLEDFLFRVGNNNSIGNWADAPTPAGFTVRPGDGVGGSTRITITWADGSIRNKWLQVGILATENTALPQADFFYFGSAVGDTGNSPSNALVNTADQLLVRNNPRSATNPAPITSPYDFNRDGLVDSTDELVARTTYSNGSTPLLSISSEFSGIGEIVGRHIFYNNSAYDGNDPAANAADDASIAPDKSPLLPGGNASFANYTSYSRGINGIMVDIAGLASVPSLSDFEFRIGNSDFPVQWTQAPTPASIKVRWGAGVDGSDRITITWADGSIVSQWLEVTVKTSVANLLQPDVFYFGNAVADTGNSPTDANITASDYIATNLAIGTTNLPLTSHLDYNRDGTVTRADVDILIAATLVESLEVINLVLPEPSVPSPVEGAKAPAFMDFVKVDVVNRGLFYNNSQFDGLNPSITFKDDNAVATDKTALLPGQSATLANYSSYSRGLNGLFIDVAGAPSDLTAADFEFRIGNNGDPSTWTLAPAPLQVLSRHGAGLNGSTRVMVVWQDNVIQNTWLQVTLKASAATGLKKADVFYFGNLIGDAGNNITRPLVNSSDQISTRNQAFNFLTTAPITHLADFNRDGLVNFSDEWTSARNQGRNLTPLTAPVPVEVVEPELPLPDFFHWGDSSVHSSFAPNLVTTNLGTVLYIGEARSYVTDDTGFGLTLKRSFDDGATWTPMTIIYQNSQQMIRSPSVVVDKVTGEIFLLFTRNDSEVLVMSSVDDGASWTNPINITSSVKVTASGNPNPAAFPNTPWGWYAVGSGHGIQLERGAYAGRLMITADHRLTPDREGPSWSHVIYSDDHGRTWKLGGGLNQGVSWNNNSNENTIVELNDGSLYMSIRVVTANYRAYSRSTNGGATWTNMNYDGALLTSSVHASVLRVNENTLIFSAPDSNTEFRQRMTIWISHDNAQTWTKTKAVFYSYASYSDMTLVGDDTVLLAFNSGRQDLEWVRHVTLVRFNLRWLTEPETVQFTWQFAENAAGETANINTPSILDDSAWDLRAVPEATSAAEAPQYVAGPNGRTALRLTESSDRVMLATQRTVVMQAERNDSFTVELDMRTTDANGVIIGTRAGLRGWILRVTDGHVELIVDDLSKKSTATSSGAIADGNWHRVTAIRNGSARTLTIMVDGVVVATAQDQTTFTLVNADATTLGSFNDGTEQLAFDVDTLRYSLKALSTGQFLPAQPAEPPRWPDTAWPGDAPNSIPGLKLWLPAYDPNYYFADMNLNDPLGVHPTVGTAAHSARDASDSEYHVVARRDKGGILYTEDAIVGPSWNHTPDSSTANDSWVVKDSNGTSAQNFDFVQNTGEFTISAFVNITGYYSSSVSLFDNIDATGANTGFSLMVQGDGSLRMMVIGANGDVRLNATSASNLVKTNSWYHVAVVAHGAGQPVTFYITPVTATNVAAYGVGNIDGANGVFPTVADQDLTIGSRKNGQAPFYGKMVDEAIYNRALTTTEVQQLFNYTNKND